jgi:hypothetical protein
LSDFCFIGHRLGYVPRDMTGSYPYEWGLAYVDSKGEAGDSGLTGVKVQSKPALTARQYLCACWH